MSSLRFLIGRGGARPGAAPTGPNRAEAASEAEQIRRFNYHGKERCSSLCSLSPVLAPRPPPTIQEFMRSAAREAMLIPDIEAYTRDNREQSVFRLVMATINRQPPAHLRTHYPPGYAAGHRLAVNHTQAEVKRQIKNVRHQVRNILLTGIVPQTNGDLPAIPHINRCAREVWRYLNAGPTLTNGEIDTLLSHMDNIMFKARVAFLRLATIENHFDPASRTVSQWEQIDHHLADLCERGGDASAAWARLVCQKDKAFFGSSPMLANVNRADCVCPTAEEVAALAADMADA
ncbi:hypothetical protein PTTG_04534 [Puccinia triticina 1-1 BBBD Race 1]|uniref:Uncharacterized protein n=1 Tax=Puccinia triticina (isolate 1-1 / race 1 (BBBD)) TaxID=630390 RepID=A0A180H424_PUCT1|nr:hypothetical protein PTTG_04534 [Puccinia triticina 1-1 BBBD Race 1]